MKKFAFILVFLPFLFNYSNTTTITKNVKSADNSCTVNFSGASENGSANYMMPDTTSEPVIDPDTLVKS